MKTVKKLSALLFALLLLASFCTAAFADDDPPAASTDPTPASTYTVNGTSFTFEKYLVMKNDANVPNVTFNFTIEAGDPIDAGTDTFEVLAGLGTPTIEADQAAFTSADTTTAEASVGENQTVAFQTTDDTSDEKYATKTVTVDFSSVVFDEPGVYRYVITEAATSYLGVTNDSAPRYLDVYVTDNDGTLVVSEYVLHTGTAAPAVNATMGTADVTTAGEKLTDKSSGFTNSYATQDLTFGKEVTGNQGSKNKYFAITVTLTNATAPGTVYDVDVTTRAEATSGSNSATIEDNANKPNAAQFTADATTGIASATFYLHDGQYVTVKGVAVGTTYAVTENAEDYQSTEKIAQTVSSYLVDGTAIALNDEVSGTVADADLFTGYTNTRDGVIPTGVALTLVPGLAIAAIAGAALCLTGRKKKNED